MVFYVQILKTPKLKWVNQRALSQKKIQAQEAYQKTDGTMKINGTLLSLTSQSMKSTESDELEGFPLYDKA